MTCRDCVWKVVNNCPWDYMYDDTDYAEDCDDYESAPHSCKNCACIGNDICFINENGRPDPEKCRFMEGLSQVYEMLIKSMGIPRRTITPYDNRELNRRAGET